MLVAAIVAALPAGPASASYRDRQRELQQLIQDKRAAIANATRREHGILAKLEESDRRRADLQRALDAVEAKLAAARDNLRAIETSLDETTIELHAKNAELESALAQLQDQQARLNARVAEIYMSEPSTFSRAYGLAEDFADVVAADQYAIDIVRNDQRMVEAIQASKSIIEQQRGDIAAKQQDLAVRRQAAADVTEKIGAIVAERAAARGAVLAQIARHRSLLASVRTQKSAYRRALDNMLAESRTIESLLRGVQRGQRVIQGRGGYLRWPVTGSITSGFGWRTHPIYGYRSFHTGIDVGAPSGMRVKAARHGRVIYTGYRGSYGLIVLIDHGNSLATLYAHLSRTFVREGERVDTQEIVGAVGSTGWSTGPHLHFEVRVSGEPVNPIRWL